MTNDNDLIKRGDAIKLCETTAKASTDVKMTASVIKSAIAALPAATMQPITLQDAARVPEIKALIEAAHGTLDAIDRINAKHGLSYIGGAPMRLAKSLGKLRAIAGGEA